MTDSTLQLRYDTSATCACSCGLCSSGPTRGLADHSGCPCFKSVMLVHADAAFASLSRSVASHPDPAATAARADAACQLPAAGCRDHERARRADRRADVQMLSGVPALGSQDFRKLVHRGFPTFP